eukprot:TRINITY_DN55028_c0_g1_i1.p1 TRINITY_DN55028_c0_g1~~TRINITY_DN55028_c0_g1_i1.p1  ORF type:complete len:655 (+),score=129.39 TRINITY_DN55028_c0_g1_i1:54-1967(+)
MAAAEELNTSSAEESEESEEEGGFLEGSSSSSCRKRRCRGLLHCLLSLAGIAAVGVLIAAIVKGCHHEDDFQPLEPLPASAEWIVIGGGASGCAAAAALADAGADVLLLERGPSDLQIPETQSGYEWPQVLATKALQSIRWTDGVWGGVAKVLGGGASINGGLFFEETDEWLRKAFGAEVDIPAFRKSFEYLKGELLTSLDNDFGRQGYSLPWIEAMGEMGLPKASEAQLGPRFEDNAEAAAWIAYSTYNSTDPALPRETPAKLVRDRLSKPNLHVVTMATVHKIVFSQPAPGSGAKPRATGVVVHTQPNGTLTVTATKGVILTAGTILTPQLLQMSGIGRKDVLANIGEPVVSDLPAGENFIDRLLLNWAVPAKQKVPLTVGYGITTNKTLGFTLESVGGGQIAGVFAGVSAGNVAPVYRTKALREVIAEFFKVAPKELTDVINNAMQFVLLHRDPKSRGTIKAVSRDANDAPAVKPNYFDDPEDMASQMRAKDFLLRLGQTEALKEWVANKIDIPVNWDRDVSNPVRDFFECFFSPRDNEHPFYTLPCLPSETTEAAWDSYFRRMVLSSYHYFGTAAVGLVVNSGDHDVIGTEGLHVADASSIPIAPGVNPQGLIMALGHYIGSRLAAKERTVEL